MSKSYARFGRRQIRRLRGLVRHLLVREAAADGMAALWVSSEFEELATVCDRVLVMADGRVRSELPGGEGTVQGTHA